MTTQFKNAEVKHENELRKILNGFGFEFLHPQGNLVEVVRVTDGRRVCQVNYPAGKNQIDNNALKHVRQKCAFGPEDGYDNKAFYEGEADLTSLIVQYAEPLKNLTVR